MVDIPEVAKLRAEVLREDWVPKSAYISNEFAELERGRLWPRVWQVACREEDIPNVGSYYTYNILDDSIIVIRTARDTIKAFNNACRHRGRTLVSGHGSLTGFFCKFHGWTYNLDGQNTKVLDKEDWRGCLKDEELRLVEFRTGVWGGWVFVNMDPDAESLEDFLGEVPRYLNCLELEKLRYRWYVSLEVPANWKTTQEAFAESYHTATTHPSLPPYMDDRSISKEIGKHTRLSFVAEKDYTPGYRFGGLKSAGVRESALELIRQAARDIHSVSGDRDYQAASRILRELPEDATYTEALAKANQFIREAAIASGAGYPAITPEQARELGMDWVIFPNMIGVPTPTCGLWYRSRPIPDNDPNRCIFEIYSLERFAPGTEPKIERKHYSDWRDFKEMPPFLRPDFVNIPEVQKGMRTRGHRATRTSPVQERAIWNFHRVLREYLFDDERNPKPEAVPFPKAQVGR